MIKTNPQLRALFWTQKATLLRNNGIQWQADKMLKNRHSNTDTVQHVTKDDFIHCLISNTKKSSVFDDILGHILYLLFHDTMHLHVAINHRTINGRWSTCLPHRHKVGWMHSSINS